MLTNSLYNQVGVDEAFELCSKKNLKRFEGMLKAKTRDLEILAQT